MQADNSDDSKNFNLRNENLDLNKICYEIPKAELHVHIEGCLEPELLLQFKRRNSLKIIEEISQIKEKYNFKNLSEFLDIYYSSSDSLVEEQDFYDLIKSYFNKAKSQGVVYAELFFDPQAHIRRGVSLEQVLNGLLRGLTSCKKEFNIDGKLIMCFLRDLPLEDAMRVFDEFLNIIKENKIENLNEIIGIGLDSAEIGYPPEKFSELFEKARLNNFKLCCHCHDEGCLPNIDTAVKLIKVNRIDHGFDVLLDEDLKRYCIEKNIPFTFCPLSTFKVQRTQDIKVYKININISNCKILNFIYYC
jgi:adenine deaminase